MYPYMSCTYYICVCSCMFAELGHTGRDMCFCVELYTSRQIVNLINGVLLNKVSLVQEP